jgi:hypothetical protein
MVPPADAGGRDDDHVQVTPTMAPNMAFKSHDPCDLMWNMVKEHCIDYRYQGSWCVKLCSKRVEFEVTPRAVAGHWHGKKVPSNPALLCPNKWKAKLGREWCWSMDDCTKVMDYFCGSFKGKALQLKGSSAARGVVTEVDGCRVCVDYYVHRQKRIFNYRCFQKHMHSATHPYCKTGVDPAYLKRYPTFAHAHDWYQEVKALQSQMAADGDFKDDTGKGVYTPDKMTSGNLHHE